MSKKDFRFGIDSKVAGIDLSRLLVVHSASTFYMRMAEDALKYGVMSGDILIIDRALKPREHDLLVVAEEGSERLQLAKKPQPREGMEVWGVVTYVIKKVRT